MDKLAYGQVFLQVIWVSQPVFPTQPAFHSILQSLSGAHLIRHLSVLIVRKLIYTKFRYVLWAKYKGTVVEKNYLIKVTTLWLQVSAVY